MSDGPAILIDSAQVLYHNFDSRIEISSETMLYKHVGNVSHFREFHGFFQKQIVEQQLSYIILYIFQQSNYTSKFGLCNVPLQ